METQVSNTEVQEVKPTNSRSKGFYAAIAAFILVILVLLFFIVSQLNNQNTNTNTNTGNETQNNGNQTEEESEANSDVNPDILLIKHIGIDLGEFDPVTNKAGDIVFTQEKLGEYDMPYFDYGFQVEANSAAPARRNPQPTFIVPLGTKVRSLVDGVVIGVPKLYSNDYSIQVAANMESQYIYETEHVINPLVEVGDEVKAGDIIAEVSDYDAHNYAGYGLYEIGILVGGNPPSHICPFQYLDESIKETTYSQLRSLYSSWNEFRGESVYDETLEVPGCIVTEAVEG